MLYVPPVGDGKFLWSNFRLNIVPPQTRPAILSNDNFHFSAFLSPFDDCHFNFKREIKDTWECSQSRKHRCERRNLNCELMIKRRRRRVNEKKTRRQSEQNLTCGVLDAKKLWLRIAQQAMEKKLADSSSSATKDKEGKDGRQKIDFNPMTTKKRRNCFVMMMMKKGRTHNYNIWSCMAVFLVVCALV